MALSIPRNARAAPRRTAGELARLRAAVESARAKRYPDLLAVEVFTDDDSAAAGDWLREVEELFAKVSPSTAIVVLQPDAPRPSGTLVPWASPRAFLDRHVTAAEWRAGRERPQAAEQSEPAARKPEPPAPSLARSIADRYGEEI